MCNSLYGCLYITVAQLAQQTAPPDAYTEYTACSMSEPRIPIFEVAFRHGMWWSIPAEMSQQIYHKYTNQEDAVYTWDWGDARAGSWQANGEETSLNRYMIDFETWEQRNVDNE